MVSRLAASVCRGFLSRSCGTAVATNAARDRVSHVQIDAVAAKHVAFLATAGYGRHCEATAFAAKVAVTSTSTSGSAIRRIAAILATRAMAISQVRTVTAA